MSMAAFPAVADTPLQGTPLGSEATSQHQIEYLFDGNTSTYFETRKANYTWGGLDLGEAHVITRIGLFPANYGTTTGLMELAVIQGANNPDFSDAIPLLMIKERPAEGMCMYYYDVDCSRGFRYIRYCGKPDTRCRLAELEIYGVKGEGDDSHLYQVTNLPTVVVNTVDAEEPYDKEHDIPGNILIISENGTELLDKPGTIRERGNASREFPKKPWRIKFDKKQQVLDAPAKAKKWTLINNYGDKTLMRNILAFETARKLGMEYVPYCQAVDVILNGEYKGCYQLCDQVEVNENRVNIEEMETTDISGEALTGGYLVEVDGYADQEVSWFRTAHYGIPVTIKSPDEDEITPEQTKYISQYFNTLEQQMKNTDPVTGYRRMFDNRSFIQHMFVNEIAGNTDTYWSTYMYKRRGDDKIYTGPVWDFDIAWDNDYRTWHVWQKSGDTYLWNCGAGSSANGMLYFAQRILLKDPGTVQETLELWRDARRDALSAEWLINLVDRTAEELAESATLNFRRWPILNDRVHMNPQAAGSYEGELEVVRNYIRNQMPHLDKVIGYDPAQDALPSVGGETTGRVTVDGARVLTEGYAPGITYNIYGLDGRLSASGDCGEPSATLSAGVYIVRLSSGVSEKVFIR